MKYFHARQEGERLVLRRSNGPLAHDALTFGGLCTALSWGAWKSWALSMGGLPAVLGILAVGTGACAARVWRQLERAMASGDSWVFDRALDLVEHAGERQCALSEVAQVHVDFDWRQESHSLLLKRRVGSPICVERSAVPDEDMSEAARLIAEFAGVELVIVRHD